MARRAFVAVLLSFLAPTVPAQTRPVSNEPPRLTSARLETRGATPNLESSFRAMVDAQTAPAWMGYAVPVVSGERQMCCWNSWNKRERCCGPCRMETQEGFSITTGETVSTRLEGPQRFFVLLRVENRRVGKVLAFSEDCELDGGGLAFVWLIDVRPAESIALLSTLVAKAAQDEEKRMLEHGVTAIALHDHPDADRALERFLEPGNSERLRKQAAFWMGAERGRRGYEALRKLVRDDPSDKVREHGVFALSMSKEAEAVDAMIGVARNDRSTHVRGQALFWLGQKAGKKAAGAISEALENDPETEVKKKAVFALSQLPQGEGVPMLIQVARTNRNPAVRKQAIFWLGQSKDPRALAFFEEVLKP